MLKILAQPYPLTRDWKHHLRVAVYISIFVTLFLLLFKPFGIGNYQHDNLNFLIAGYGFVTLSTLLFVFFVSRIIKPLSDEERWTTGKEILSQLLYIFVLGIANVCYTHFAFGLHFSLSAFVNFQIFTLLIGIFPVSFFVLTNHIKLSKQNEKVATELSDEINKRSPANENLSLGAHQNNQNVIHLTSENEKDIIDVPVDDLILIESADNYSTVYYLQNGKIANKLLRSSLKRLEAQAQHENLLRCHRTYIVNLKKVTMVTGNAQGYRLRFNGFDQTFPVSRTLNETIKERLHHLASS